MNQSTRALKTLAREPYIGTVELSEIKKLTEAFQASQHEFERLQSEVHQIWRRLK